jgi:hypothetical protein
MHTEYVLNSSFATDIKDIYAPTILATTALYIPIFFLSIFRISNWFFAIPIHPIIRSVPLFNTAIAGLAAYYAQKVCEWLLIRRNEFHQWSFSDIHHELYFYRIYTQSINLRKLNPTRKQIFYTGSIQFIKHYLLFDMAIYLLIRILNTDLYERYFFMKILINLFSGWVIYLFLTIQYEIIRYTFCLIFNRPLEMIPTLFRQPYRAISPSDFWTRWHQM